MYDRAKLMRYVLHAKHKELLDESKQLAALLGDDFKQSWEIAK